MFYVQNMLFYRCLNKCEGYPVILCKRDTNYLQIIRSSNSMLVGYRSICLTMYEQIVFLISFPDCKTYCLSHEHLLHFLSMFLCKGVAVNKCIILLYIKNLSFKILTWTDLSCAVEHIPFWFWRIILYSYSTVHFLVFTLLLADPIFN